ncbi:MAG: hypothetical protein PQJ61_11715 [Spirochaetales bacterium]|uniref:Uncharacterized protein n=1 Tax=Candidatus Thalassospirochaeta sargassi TaxID=3119039 RepID=A0AAJ1MN72_9SPIO|nr:hypothetical protein [Spirochaetales bacterium]
MAYSDDFYRQISKRAEKGLIELQKVRGFLFDFLQDVPEDLRWDIFSLFFPDAEDNTRVSVEDASGFTAVIDLFEGEYEEDKLALTDEQLKYISEGVNDFALDLSDEVLMNVMQAAVSRGLLG